MKKKLHALIDALAMHGLPRAFLSTGEDEYPLISAIPWHGFNDVDLCDVVDSLLILGLVRWRRGAPEKLGLTPAGGALWIQSYAVDFDQYVCYGPEHMGKKFLRSSLCSWNLELMHEVRAKLSPALLKATDDFRIRRLGQWAPVEWLDAEASYGVVWDSQVSASVWQKIADCLPAWRRETPVDPEVLANPSLAPQ